MKDLLLFRRTLTRREYWIILGLQWAVTCGLALGFLSLSAYVDLLPLESSWTPAQMQVFATGVLVLFLLLFYLYLVVIIARCKDAGLPIRFVIPGLILLSGLPFIGWGRFGITGFLMPAALIGLGSIPTKISEEERFRRKVIAEASENVREQFKDEMEEIAEQYTAEEVEEIIRQLKAEERNARPEEKP